MLKLNNLLHSVKPGDDEVKAKPGKDDDLNQSKNKSLTEKTELEILVQRRSDEVRKKAKYHWSLLRNSVCSVKRAVEEAELKDLVITHGIHRERKLNHPYGITQVIFLPNQREYLTCDGHNFRFFMEDGRKKDLIPTEEGINRLIYSNQTNQFVGWAHGEQSLYLMSTSFVITSQSNAVGKILLTAYNGNTGELITVGPHFITCWSFRYGARHLIPRKTTKTKFGEKKMFVQMVLEETASRTQRMFFAQGNGVVVYNVFSGLEITHKKELHAQPITALTFFNPLKYVITGARDGCIKIWDSNWKVKMVFVGHNDHVNFLSIYPHGPAFISASLDCTIRVWNMETCDEVDKTVISEPIEAMGTHMNYDIFYTQAGKHVDLWKLEHLFHIHTNIGYRVNTIKVTTHPSHPQRAVLMCRDSSIRIVCPTNGEVLTTLLMNPTDGLVDAAYAIAENVIFTVVGCGDIIKSRTDVNPCQAVCRWKCSDIQEMCNYLLVYEYVVDPTASNDIWAMMKRSVQTKTVQQTTTGSANNNRTLLLGGRKDGYICVFDWNTGDVTFKVEAHGSKGVLNMIANSKSDQLISAGMDNIIKVWRLYPFAQEALAPLMSFYCAHTPSFMTTIKTSLGVAFQDPSTATFSVVLYSLPAKTFAADNPQLEGFHNRNDHKPDDDHMDLITGLTSCARMKLYASCGMDGTIRIWNEDNMLIRLIRINTIPNSLAFCSHKGDLLVGIGNHLFFISHTKYLPKTFLRRQACMRFSTEKEEDPVDYDENRLNKMDKNDVKRLKNSHASFKFTHFVDILSPEEEQEVMKEKKMREEAFSELESRENEIQLIRDGALVPKPKRQPTKRTKMRAFKEYMKMYYSKEKEVLVKEEDVIAKHERDDEEEETEEKFRPDTAPYGFFSEASHKSSMEAEDVSTSPCYPSGPSGYLPNSVLIKILYPPPAPPAKKRDATPYQPPVLNAQQLEEIHSLHAPKLSRRDSEFDTGGVSRTVTFAADEHLSRVLELDLSDEETGTIDKEPTDVTPADEGVMVDFDDVIRKGQMESAAGTSSGAATFATPARSSALTIRTFSDLPDSRPFTTPKSSQKSRSRSRKKTSFLEDDEDDEDAEDMSLPGGMSQASTSLMSKFQDILDKPPSEPIVEESDIIEPEEEAGKEEVIAKVVDENSQEAAKRNELIRRRQVQLKRLPRRVEKSTLTEDQEEEEPTPQPTEPIKKKPQTMSKPITKFISRPKPKARTPTPPRSPTPPPPPTPLPNFIKQFVGTEWFDKYFPNCNENTMPKPWTSDTFVNMIVKLLRIADWLHKVSVSDAIIFINTAEGLSDAVIKNVVKTLLSVLNHHTTPPSCNVAEQKSFIMAGLKALSLFCLKDKDVLAELMVQFLDGDKDVRASVLEVMNNLGLVDPHRQFQKELDSWDIWGIDEKNHTDELHRMSNQWLDRWMASYKLRIKDTVEKLNKGHSLQGRLSNRGSILGGGSRRGSVMPPETETTLPGSDGGLGVPGGGRTGRVSAMSHGSLTGKDLYIGGGRTGRVSAMSHGSLTVTVERMQGSSIMDSVTYIDALSYFCEMMMEKELEALRRGELLRRQAGDNVVQAKNTVLVLPKIAHKPALVRLGEMHTSKTRPTRESDFTMPPIKGRQPAPGDLTSFTPSINLPMKPVYLNPFPSAIDEHDAMFRQPILITLKSSQKFFIPSQSYVPFEENVAVGS